MPLEAFVVVKMADERGKYKLGGVGGGVGCGVGKGVG